MNGLTAENILSVLPSVLAEDAHMHALAESVSDILSSRLDEIRNVAIYPRVNSLPEDLLDILAYDFKVDWWDYGYTIEEKRDTLARSWYVHRHMGTPSAVSTALSSIYPDTRIEEWFTYDGEPYHFKIIIQTGESGIDPEKHARVMQLVNFYKNLRSILDSVEYSGSGGTVTIYTATAAVGIEIDTAASAD